jgi:hypothetical protein
LYTPTQSGMANFVIHTRTHADGCEASTTMVGMSLPGVADIELDWPESDLGETVSLKCPCGNFSALGGGISRNASRVCGGDFTTGAVWETSMDSKCDLSPTTRRLCEVFNVSPWKFTVGEIW